MIISGSSWGNYIKRLRKVNDAAADKMTEYLQTHEVVTQGERKQMLDYAYGLATHYGEGAAELACQMYDAAAEAQGASVPPAEPAETATYGEVAKAVQGTMKYSEDPEVVGSSVGRLVKMAGVDTTMKNAIRDRAEWAWIPSGDTCAFCLTLASRGFQKASKKVLKGNHAEHIHANCDCTFFIRFDGKSTIEGYDPDALLKEYRAADGGKPQEKINSMRRAKYQLDKERINAQKREQYAKRQSAVEGIAAKVNENWIKNLAPDERDKYEEIIKRGTDKMQHGFSCFGDSLKDKLLREGAARIIPKENFFDVSMHGTDKAVCFGGNQPNMSPRLLADLIKRHPGYHGENIRLLCCDTGKTSSLADWEYCFAEELANNLGVIVEAPDDLVYIRRNGTWYIGNPGKVKLIPFKPNKRGRFK